MPGEGLSEEQRRRRLRECVDNVGIRRERHGERLLLWGEERERWISGAWECNRWGFSTISVGKSHVCYLLLTTAFSSATLDSWMHQTIKKLPSLPVFPLFSSSCHLYFPSGTYCDLAQFFYILRHQFMLPQCRWGTIFPHFPQQWTRRATHLAAVTFFTSVQPGNAPLHYHLLN